MARQYTETLARGYFDDATKGILVVPREIVDQCDMANRMVRFEDEDDGFLVALVTNEKKADSASEKSKLACGTGEVCRVKVPKEIVERHNYRAGRPIHIIREAEGFKVLCRTFIVKGLLEEMQEAFREEGITAEQLAKATDEVRQRIYSKWWSD